jgi:hypothetical protein
MRQLYHANQAQVAPGYQLCVTEVLPETRSPYTRISRWV